MADRPYLLAETTWQTVCATDYHAAVLPWGATEAHNRHLPYTTDNIQCDHIAAAAAERAWARGAHMLVLPTVPFGVNTGHRGIKGTVNMRPSTQAAVLRDVADSLAAQGFDRLVVLNGHGGNNFKALLRELQADVPELFVSLVNWFRIGNHRDYFTQQGDHAGEMETSVMLHIAPDLVRPLSEAGEGAARAFRIDALRAEWAWAERHWPSVTDDTGSGNPKPATAEKGAEYLEEVTTRIADYFVDLAAANLDDLYA